MIAVASTPLLAMTIIPPPTTYKSPTMNRMMQMVNPSNIDGVMAEMERMKKDHPMLTDADFVMRLSIETNLAALSARRLQYVECGVLANVSVQPPAGNTPEISTPQ